MTHRRPSVVVTTYVRSGSDQVRHAVVLPSAPTRRRSEPLSRYDRLDPAPLGRSRVNVHVEGLDRLREAMAAMAQQVNARRFSTDELAYREVV